MATDKALLLEVTKELWQTVNKLRPDIDEGARLELVLKALLTIGDLPDQIDAAMVVGICSEIEKNPTKEIKNTEHTNDSNDSSDSQSGRRVVRRRSAAT